MNAPGPTRTQVISDFNNILNHRLDWIYDLQKKYGDVVRIPLGHRVSYAVFHPDLFRHVLVANAKNYWKGRTFEKAAGYLGRGLATNEGKPWQIQRRRMNPHFHRQALANLSETMVFVIEKVLDRWEQQARAGKELVLADEFQRLALEVVVRSLFGTDVAEEKISDVISAFKTALVFTTKRTMNPFDVPDWLPLSSNREFKKAISFLDEVVEEMIRKEYENPKGTLLSVLLSAQDPETGECMSPKQVRDEVMTMFLGGTDTSGNTLSWVLYNLNRYPQMMTDLRAEVESVLGSEPFRVEKMGELKLLKRIVDETLRLYPQNWTMSRDNYEQDTLGGYTIPKGSTVFLGVYVAHRRPDFWTDPERFDPDRFLPENLKGRHALAFLPFGGGPRKCIGYPFAQMEFAVALSRIVQRFDVEILNMDQVTTNPTWSLWPKPGLQARVTVRDPSHSVGAPVQPGLRTEIKTSSETLQKTSGGS